jgi:hypothetical protein
MIVGPGQGGLVIAGYDRLPMDLVAPGSLVLQLWIF